MSARQAFDPYETVLRAFNRVGVRYVVVGMSGINYYARQPSEAFATMDYDLFLEPTISNVGKAIRQLERLGFSIGTTRGVFTPGALRTVVREQRTLVATTPDGVTVELLLAVSGYTFSELASDAPTVTVRGTPIRVGRLAKLLKSKQLAGRPKDRQFLKRYKTLLSDGA
jgi:predicted nucleotidyltransferase